MTEKFLRWLSFGALAFLLLVGIYKIVAPEISFRQTIAQNVVLAAQVQQLQQQAANQNQALATLFQDAEMKPIILRKFPGMFSPVQSATGNGIAPKR